MTRFLDILTDTATGECYVASALPHRNYPFTCENLNINGKGDLNMSTFLLMTGLVVAVSTMTFIYLRRQLQQQRNLKPEIAPQEQHATLEFPVNYGKNQVNLLVRDPEWLYAYWEITATAQTDFSRQFGNCWDQSKPLLRVYDVTNAENEVYYDIQIQDYSDSWYIHVGKPNHTFFVDVGRVLPDGSFYCIARSNLVTTPSNKISDVIDPNWVPIEAIWSSLRDYELEGITSSPDLAESRCR
jgi:hypothetical protein